MENYITVDFMMLMLFREQNTLLLVLQVLLEESKICFRNIIFIFILFRNEFLAIGYIVVAIICIFISGLFYYKRSDL